jgi:hypothetical protein
MEEKIYVERFYELVLRLTNEWEVIGVRRDNEKQAVYVDFQCARFKTTAFRRSALSLDYVRG